MRPLRLVRDPEARGRLRLSPGLLRELDLPPTPSARHRLAAGGLACEVGLAADPGLPADRAAAGPDVLDALRLPTDVPYRLKNGGRGLELGPVVGILASRRIVELPQTLRILLPCCDRYGEIGGLVVAFAAEGADFERRRVDGYYYRPADGGGSRAGAWVPALLPFPAAIHRQAALPGNLQRRLVTATGGRMFNVPYFDKWQAWCRLAPFPEVRPHLPETRLLQGPDDVLAILRRYGAAILKPRRSRKGKGIALVTEDGPEVVFRWHDGDRSRRAAVPGPEGLDAVVRRLTGGRAYLVQQAVPLLRPAGRAVDFRLMMQKAPGGHWVCRGIVARRAGPGRVITNASNGGRALRLERALAGYRGPGGTDALVASMVRAATLACEALDRLGDHQGDLGVDVGVDEAGHPWLFELNNRAPAPTLALLIRDRRLYRTIKAGPTLYAAWLAGF